MLANLEERLRVGEILFFDLWGLAGELAVERGSTGLALSWFRGGDVGGKVRRLFLSFLSFLLCALRGLRAICCRFF